MRRIFLALALQTCFAGAHAAEEWHCKTASGHEYTSSQNVPVDRCRKVRTIPEPKLPPRPDSALFCKSNSRANCSQIGPNYEEGMFGGVAYRIGKRIAGVASVPGADPAFVGSNTRWGIDCERDKMTDLRSCVVTFADLTIVLPRPTQAFVVVGRQHYPGTTSSIKIGPHRFDTTDQDGIFPSSAPILGYIKDGENVVTRYTKWPDRRWRDNEFRLYGAEAALAIATWMVAQPDN